MPTKLIAADRHGGFQLWHAVESGLLDLKLASSSDPILSPVFKMMRWGFIPHFAKARNEGFKHINARAETVSSKGMFKRA